MLAYGDARAGKHQNPTAGELSAENPTCLDVVPRGVWLLAAIRVASPGAIQPGPIIACRLMFDCLMSASDASRPRLSMMALKESRARLNSFGRQQWVVPCAAPDVGDGPVLDCGDTGERPGVELGRTAPLAEVACARKSSKPERTLDGRLPSLSAAKPVLGGRHRAARPGGKPAGNSEGRRGVWGWDMACTGRRVVGFAVNGGSS